MLEIISKRTENSKTFDLGDGKRQLVTGGTVHYKDNYEDNSEQWKDIDLTFVNGRIDKALYILEINDLTITLTSKKTGTVQTLTLDRIGANPPQRPVYWVFSKNTATLNNVAPATDLVIEAGANVVRFKRIIKNASASMGAAFTHSKNIGKNNDIAISVSTRDAGGWPLEVTKTDVAGILTERISDKVDLSKVKFPIEIDPTLTVQPSAKDTALLSDTPDALYGTEYYCLVGDAAASIRRIIAEFSISGLPVGATLASASLQFYYYGSQYTDPVGKTVWAYKLTRTDWVEAQASWNDYKTSTAWTAGGGDYVTSSPAGGSTTFPADVGWIAWNVLAIVQDAYDGSIAAEFLLKFEDETLTSGNSRAYFYTNDYTTDTDLCPKLIIVYIVAPTVTTQAVSSIATTTATGNGNITATGGENADHRGVVYGTTSKGDPGNTAYNATEYDSYEDESGSFGTGAFTRSLTGLSEGQTYYVRAYAHNSAGYSYGGEVSFKTATKTTKTTAVDVLLKTLGDTKTTSITALLKAQDTATAQVDVLLKKLADTKEAAIDIYLKAQDTKTTSIDILIASRFTKTTNLDVLIKSLGLTKTAAIDILLRKLGITKTADLDILLVGRDTKTVQLDAILKGLGITKEVSLDVFIRKLADSKTVSLDTLLVGRDTRTTAIDAILKATDLKTVSLDVLLKGLGVTKTTDLDLLLREVGVTKTTAIDIHVADRLVKTVDLDALLRDTDSKTAAVDLMLKELGVTKTADVDVLLVGHDTRTAAIDILLWLQPSVTVSLDIILVQRGVAVRKYIIEIRDSSGNLIAILENAHNINYTQNINNPHSLRFSIPSDDSKEANLILANEIWLRDYANNTIVKKFRLGQKRDIRS